MPSPKKKNISLPNVKLIWGESAGFCAKCRKKVIEKMSKGSVSPIGELAHIEGEKPGAKRYNPSQSEEDRNSHKNLILMCPNDHRLIDKDDNTFTVDVLQKMKEDHQEFVSTCIQANLPNITYAELEVIVSYLVSPNSSADNDSSLVHIAPQEKIDKNKLSNSSAKLITMGMVGVNQVKSYLNNNPDVDFSERLRTKLTKYYIEAKKEESDPNMLLRKMLNYMSGNSIDLMKQAAALVVLTYFFETCDIFEK